MRDDSGMKYIPISVDFTVPRECEASTLHGKICRLIIKVQKKIGLLIYNDLTYEKQIDEQLKIRKKFPKTEWEKLFSNVTDIEKVLKDVSEDVGRVNHHYIPSDLLFFLLYDDVESTACDYMVFAISDVFGIDYSPDDIAKKARGNYSLAEFLNEIMKKQSELT